MTRNKIQLLALLMILGIFSQAKAFVARPSFAEPSAKFDEPLLVQRQPIAKSETILNEGAKVSCFEYKNFGVKEIDHAEKGAASLVLLPKLKKGEAHACGEKSERGEIALDILSEDYFWGVKEDIAFFVSADSRDGFSTFSAFDGVTGKWLWQKPYAGDDFQITSEAGRIGLRFKTEIRPECDDPRKDKVCWQKALRSAGAPAKLYPAPPSCGGKNSTFAAPVRILDLRKKKLEFLGGNLECIEKS